MKKYYLPIFAGLLCLAGQNLFASVIATAAYTVNPAGPGVYQYNLTLNNTGTTTIGTFWFSWIPGQGFMSATPTNILSPAGWNGITTNAGSAIQWTTSSSLLAPGNSVSGFEFDSTMTPAQIQGPFAGPGIGVGDPISTAFVYIAAPLADPGFQLTATQTMPEPSTTLSATFGLGLLALGGYFLRKKRSAFRA